ncbi:MAG: SDR family oxidoreductase [Myxococcaceae bacterium]
METKVVVITGASSGVGASLAKQLSNEGHQLVLGARRSTELEAVAAACGGKAIAVPADVTRKHDVESLMKAALEKHGRVDVWVNNASVTSGKRVADLEESEIDRVFGVNFKGAVFGAQAVIPHFIQRGSGHLINVGCFFGRVPLGPARVAYNASKAALDVLTADLRMEITQAHPQIEISLVLPGPIADSGSDKLPLYPGVNLQSADEIADTIAGVIEAPRREVYSVPFLKALARRYHDDVDEFEAGMAQPLLRAPMLRPPPRPE